MRKRVFEACSFGRTKHLGTCSIDLVQGMFRQLDFINKICPHYEYWTESRVIEAAILRYERFMALIAVNKREEDAGANSGHRSGLARPSDDT